MKKGGNSINNESSTKKGLPQELPEELLADVAGGDGRYSSKGYDQVSDMYGRCNYYEYRWEHLGRVNKNPDDCLRCKYFRVEATSRDGDYIPYCTYPDDYVEISW